MKMNAGIWIGIVGGLIGLVVGIGGALASGDATGVYIAGGIILLFGGMFFLFYKLFFAQMILAGRLRKTGLPGKAVIKDVRDTGVTINNSPQVKLMLEVRSSLGQVYNATARVLVSRLQPNLYQAGMTVPVLIDPKNENNVIIDDSGGTETRQRTAPAFSSQSESLLKDQLMKEQQEGDAIRLTGRSARAIVKKYTWLGVNINGNNPYAEIEIEVMPADAPAFTAKVKGAISEQSVSKYQPGEEIFVKYDAYDLTKVAIDHS